MLKFGNNDGEEFFVAVDAGCIGNRLSIGTGTCEVLRSFVSDDDDELSS